FDDDEWIFENKWDGYRAIAEVQNGNVNLYSRNSLSLNSKYPSLINELNQIEYEVVWYDEIVVMGKDDKVDFQMLQKWGGETDKGKQLIYGVFDILYLNGHEVIGLPLYQRKELLDEFFKHFESNIIINTEFVEVQGKKLFEKA